MFKLKDFINTDHIFFDLKSENKIDILNEIVTKICEAENIQNKKDSLYDKIIEREEIESTAIGNGFAIPHCHHPEFTGVSIYVGYPEFPIDFQSKIDDSLVRVIFLIISGDEEHELYLKALSRLVYLLRNSEARENLISASNRDQLHSIIVNSDNESSYISFQGLPDIISLLKLEDEIATYSHEMSLDLQKSDNSYSLEEDTHYIELLDTRKELISKIDHRLIQIYNQLKTKYGGDIISKVQNQNICGHCNVQIPVHLIREINRQNQIIQCTTCSKILIHSRGKF